LSPSVRGKKVGGGWGGGGGGGVRSEAVGWGTALWDSIAAGVIGVFIHLIFPAAL